MCGLVSVLILVATVTVSAQDRWARVPDEAKPMADQKLAEFLGSVPPPAITWRKYIGPDFDVYYGHANPPLSGDISFYLGCCSGFTPEPQSSIVEGKLGRFPVRWHRRITDDDSVTQNALVEIDHHEVDIAISARRQQEVDQLVAVVGRLAIFNKVPKTSPSSSP